MKMELVAALLHRPRVVFLDEPTIGLDLTAQRAIRDFLLRYREAHRPAILLTSHYMEDIERLCERIVIIRDGEFVYDGPLAKVKERYADHKVLTAHLHRNGSTGAGSDGLEAFGDVFERTEAVVRMRVPRGGVPAAAARMLERLPVVDLAIEEPDIGTIIERIFRERREAAR